MRRWSWSLGALFGIEIRVHATLYVLLVWLGVLAPIAGLGVRQTLAQVALVVGVFSCILAHELAHSLVARRFGCRTREILLLPIGGIAQLERMPERPAQELLVTVAGPAMNGLIAVALGACMAIAGWPIDPEQPSLLGAIIVPMFWVNVSIALFNLVPAFPMDGGRILRAALAAKLGRARATRIAAIVGKLLAVVFVGVALTTGAIMLGLIGVFVWFSAESELAYVLRDSSSRVLRPRCRARSYRYP